MAIRRVDGASGWAVDGDALDEFLNEPNLCRLATLDARGEPHVVPAWFWWDGACFWIGAQGGDRKIANVRRRGRATVEVDSDIRRKRGLFARGAAQVIDGADGHREYVRVTTRMIPRYQPGQPPIETAERFGRSGSPVVIVITPDEIVSWGR